MPDSKYCYPDTDILINKLNIKDSKTLFKAEERLTSIRLQELQNEPIVGKFGFKHLKKIHEYVFQDLYKWAGKTRTVDIGKGNLFCTVPYIDDYAYYEYTEYSDVERYNEIYKAKINKMDSEGKKS